MGWSSGRESYKWNLTWTNMTQDLEYHLFHNVDTFDISIYMPKYPGFDILRHNKYRCKIFIYYLTHVYGEKVGSVTRSPYAALCKIWSEDCMNSVILLLLSVDVNMTQPHEPPGKEEVQGLSRLAQSDRAPQQMDVIDADVFTELGGLITDISSLHQDYALVTLPDTVMGRRICSWQIGKAENKHAFPSCYFLLYLPQTESTIVGEFTFCGNVNSTINKSCHYIGPGPCSLKVSVNTTGLEIEAHLMGKGRSSCTQDTAATTPEASSEICITWKGHVGQLYITRGDVVKSYSAALSTEGKCCQRFTLTTNTSHNNSPWLRDIIYVNQSNFHPVHMEKASYLEFTASEGACETPFADCINQKNNLNELTNKGQLTVNDARYAMLLTNRILEECNESSSVRLESDLRQVLKEMDFTMDSKTFVLPNVKAAVINPRQSGSLEFQVTANFSWVGPDGQAKFTAVRIYLTFQLPLSSDARAVVIQLQNQTLIQGQERKLTSPDVTIQVGSSTIDDLSAPLTVTFQELTFLPNPTPCHVFSSSGNGTFDQNGCKTVQNGVNNKTDTITCRCHILSFFFELTLESKDIFDIFPSNEPFKMTTWSNHTIHVDVTTPVTGSPCETPLESTTSMFSSAGVNQSCDHLQRQLNESEQCTSAVKLVNEFTRRCVNQTHETASFISVLENQLLQKDCKTKSQVVETENVIFYTRDMEAENFTGLQFPNSDTENISAFDPAVAITLPSTLLDNIDIAVKVARSKVLLFSDASLFQAKNQTILSRVVGIQVGNSTFDNLTDPVIIVFNKPSPVNDTPKCVFWKLEQNGSTVEGHWSHSGCTTTITVNEVTCQCNHLTFFAVLLQIDGNPPVDEKTLKSLTYITWIGCGVSVIFTVITLIIHFILRKGQKEASIQIHVNLSAALFLLNANFLTSTAFSFSRSDEFCKAIAALLHYSLLCSFTWMGIEAFHLYLMLIKVFNIYIRFYMLKLCLLGWGFPAGMLLVIIGMNTENYGRYSIPVIGSYDTSHMCWIKNKTVHYVTNVAYFALMFLGNSIMLLIVCVKVFRLKGTDRKSVFSVLGLTCLLGITYGIAFFSHGPQSVLAMYLFCILNPLQGFFVFLWYCMLLRSPNRIVSDTSKNTNT
ncbi:uncharacterized protein LOC125459918 [Stegostoma tigrinum]|uniref:uncharacterized protein LOC125459918 n=1 Tax=Stegostoma tigrinum TaxID=3053191 RepID=UPI00286FC12E|nr:uncharacterized protein LOC125459918 [Stegostoma tigrinum]